MKKKIIKKKGFLMIKIYFNNELKEVPIGTMVIDLIEDNKKTDYMVCQIG